MHVVPSSTLCLLNLYATLERCDCHQACIFGKRWSISPISKASNLRIWARMSTVALEGHGGCHAKFSWRPTYKVQHCPHFVLSINQAQMVSTQPPECPRESQQSRSHAMFTLRMIAAHRLQALTVKSVCAALLQTPCAREVLPAISVHPNQPFTAESVRNASAHSRLRIWSSSRRTFRISANATKREQTRTSKNNLARLHR